MLDKGKYNEVMPIINTKDLSKEAIMYTVGQVVHFLGMTRDTFTFYGGHILQIGDRGQMLPVFLGCDIIKGKDIE